MNFAKFRTELRNYVSSYPSVYFLLSRAKNNAHFISSETEVVIEGFPRCGNSFAEAAFRVAQGRDIKIAHHSHAAAQVIRARELEIPCIVVFRSPESAVTSFLKFKSHTHIRQTINQYIRFYRDILPHKDGYILASFEAVTSNFELVVDLLNEKFNCQFGRFEQTANNVKRAFDMVDKLTQERKEVDETEYSPNRSLNELNARKKALERIKHDVKIQEKERLREANRIYQKLVAYQDC